jgi:penicillin-binding protein 1A
MGDKMTGARVALPVWTEFMKAAHVGLPKEGFEEPPGVVWRKVCAQTGELAGPDCEETLDEVFIQGTEPGRQCRAHAQTGRGIRIFTPRT